MIQQQQTKRSVRPAEGAVYLGVGRSTFWRWAAERPDFPKGKRLSPRVTVFDLDELVAWRDAQSASTPARDE